jgi:hypothetical protein
MLAPQRTTTDCVCFVVTFLISRSKSELINEINGSRSLPVRHYFRLEIVTVGLPNSINVSLGIGELDAL